MSEEEQNSATMLERLEDRLKGEVDGLNQVGSAAEFAAIKKGPIMTPAAYVVPEDENAQPNTAAAGGHIQRVVSRVAVVLAHRSHRDARGGAGARELGKMKDEILKKVAGWGGFSYGGSRLLGLLDGIVWEQVTFIYERQLRVSD